MFGKILFFGRKIKVFGGFFYIFIYGMKLFCEKIVIYIIKDKGDLCLNNIILNINIFILILI